MDRQTATRRTVLKGLGASLAAVGLGATTAAADGEWVTPEVKTDVTLHDVTETTAGQYAVGGSGIVMERGTDVWHKELGGGPTGNGNNLYGAGVTDDGSRLWFVGSSGAIGAYDVERRTLTDHSAPNDVTNNFNGVAVTGDAGEANVYVAGDSGKVYYSFDNGKPGTWNAVTPGSGSAIAAIDFHGPRSGHIVDTNGTVFATSDGSTWNAIGIGDANVTFYGVDSDAPDDVTVVGGGGMVFRWDGTQWTPTDLGDKSLRDVEYTGGDGYTVGGGGSVYDATEGTWSQEPTGFGDNLKSVVNGSPTTAVGSGGFVAEYRKYSDGATRRLGLARRELS